MSEMLVANAPVSWGVYEADDDKNTAWPAVLDAISEAGYGGTELGPFGYLPKDPDALAAELSRRGLKLGSSFVPLPLEDASAREQSVKTALEIAGVLARFGVEHLIIADDEDPARARAAGRIAADGSQGWSDDQWREACATLDAVARAIDDAFSMKVVVHHHAGTFVETPDEIARLLDGTHKERVGLLLDTGHCLYGGGDPLAVYERHADRTWYVHLKDADADKLKRVRTTSVTMQDAWKDGVFCVLGQGAADFPALLDALRARDYAGWLVVEQDVVPDAQGNLDPDPFVAAKQSRVFLKGLGV